MKTAFNFFKNSVQGGTKGLMPSRRVWELLKEPLTHDVERCARLWSVEMG